MNSNQFEISTALKSRSVLITISLELTLGSQTPFKNFYIYMVISLLHFSNPYQDSNAHAQMMTFN